MINWRKQIIYSLLYLTGSKISQNLKEIKKTEKFSDEEKKEYQEEKLKKLLLYSSKNVPYYKKVLKECGVVKNNEVFLENFHKIPFLTKEIIRKEKGNLISKERRKKTYENTSGGSTGEPVRFLQDGYYDDWNIASKIYFFKKFGKDEGQPEIKFWGSDRDILLGNLTMKDRIVNFLYNRKFFNTYNLNDEKFDELISLNNSFKPVSYWAYVDAMEKFAKYINEKNKKIFSPKMIVTTIGPLYPEARQEIEKAFKTNVFNQYGSREMGWVAFENEKDLEVCVWRQVVELEGKEEEKDLIITSLDNYVMPLIRYKIGDVATEGSFFEIHRVKSYLTLGNVLGRTLGFFKLKDGSLKHTHFIVQQFFFRDWIEKFQIIQSDYDVVKVRVVAEKNKKEINEMNEIMLKFLGRDFQINWEFVKEIKPSKSGKYLYTICEVE